MTSMDGPKRIEKGGFSFVSSSPEETRTLAGHLSRYSFPGLAVLISGVLGTGKTEFVRGFVSSMTRDKVRSPSFTLINEYKGDVPIAHVDLYRIEKNASMEISIDEYLREGFIVLLEWPENWDGEEPQETWKIELAMPEGFIQGAGGESTRFVKAACWGEAACQGLERFISWFRSAREGAER
ncbi:MAG: tRNA (adenosine(37)-N6)-threonylcarbamoyltransferase complex ATPase subunit type 1 TsaE [Thermovirgaceae bacterium]